MLDEIPRRHTVRDSPTMHEAGALIADVLPKMVELLERPHAESTPDQWAAIRDELRVDFAQYGWVADEADVAFDLLCAFADREHEREVSA